MGRLSEYINSGKAYARRNTRRRSTRSLELSEFQELAKILNALPKEFTGKQRKEMLGKAAVIVQEGIKAEAPVYTKPHKIKDENGTLKRVKPGNLKRSIQIFTFRRTADVFVGPISSKRTRGKSVPGQKRISRRKRAFYWIYVYYGTMFQAPNRFIDRGEVRSKEKALKVLGKEAVKIIEYFIKRFKLN